MLLSNVFAPQIVTTAAQIPTLVSSMQTETLTPAAEALVKFVRNKELFSQEGVATISLQTVQRESGTFARIPF